MSSARQSARRRRRPRADCQRPVGRIASGEPTPTYSDSVWAVVRKPGAKRPCLRRVSPGHLLRAANVGGRVDTRTVAGSTHDAGALSRFQNGDKRLVYARYKGRPDDPPYYLEDGSACEVRAWAKEHLECFMPDCESRRLTTVARSNRRDGFSHMAGAGGHSKESLFHQQAKALICRWVDSSCDGVQAVSEQATPSGERRADVMLTWENGRQLAVEVQYAPLTPHDWRTRHESYRTQGINCVWLLGHLRPNLTAGYFEGTVSLGPLHAAMVAAGETLLWINPVEELIGTAWTHASAHECADRPCLICKGRGGGKPYEVPPDVTRALPVVAYFGADPLRQCSVTPDGVVTAKTRELASTRDDFLTARRADDERQAGIRVARQLRERQERERLAAVAAKVTELERETEFMAQWVTENALNLSQTWLKSPVHTKLVGRHGRVPDLLGQELESDRGVREVPLHWHALLYVEHILGLQRGQTFTIADCYRTLERHQVRLHSDADRRSTAVAGYLEHLQQHGLVRVIIERGKRIRIIQVVVLDDVDTAAVRRADDEADRRAEQEELERQRIQRAMAWARGVAVTRREARERRARRLAASQALSASTASRTNPAAEGPHYTRCVVCGRPLAEVLSRAGRHISC